MSPSNTDPGWCSVDSSLSVMLYFPLPMFGCSCSFSVYTCVSVTPCLFKSVFFPHSLLVCLFSTMRLPCSCACLYLVIVLLGPVFYPDFVEIRSVVFVSSCRQTDKQPDTAENTTNDIMCNSLTVTGDIFLH